MAKRTFTIYALKDPHTEEVRYIGQTIRPRKRKREHMTYHGTGNISHYSNWKKSLLDKGVKPIWEVLEKVRGQEEANKVEREWISHGREQGWPLTNTTSGGEADWRMAPEVLEKMSKASQEFWDNASEEKKSKILGPLLEAAHSPEARSKAMATRVENGYYDIPENRYKCGNAWRGKSRPQEIIEKQRHSVIEFYGQHPEYAEAARERTLKLWQDPEYREKTLVAHKKAMEETFAEPYPAFYNIDTEEIIPAGENLNEILNSRDDMDKNIYFVKNGKRNMAQGWILLSRKDENIFEKTGSPYPAFYNIETGEIIPKGTNLAKLCRERKLNRICMCRVKNKEQMTHKNWILLSRKEELTS